MIQAIEGYLRSKKTWKTGPDDMEVDAVVKGRGQPKGKGKSKGKGKVTRARDSPKEKSETRARGKEKPVSQRARRIRNPTASVLFAVRLDIVPKIVITEFVQ